MCICSFLSCFLSWVSRAHLAVIFLWTAGVVCSISFVAPFWMIVLPASYFGMGGACPREDIGLLSVCCATKKCEWVWDNGFDLEIRMPEWRRVIQILFLCGLLLLLPVLVMSPFRFCCQCGQKSIGISRVFAVFTFLSAALCGSAVLYFFYNILWGQTSVSQTLTRVTTWAWAFVMGVVGTGFTLLSCMCWYLDSKRQIGSMTTDHQNEHNRRERRRFLKR